MRPGGHGRLDRAPVSDLLIHADGGREPRDVVLDRAGEQAGNLGQVADPARQLIALACLILRAVQPHGSGLGLQGSGDDAGESGLARTARADDAEGLARLQREGHAAQLRVFGVGEFHRYAFDLQPTLGVGQGGAFAFDRGGAGEQFGQGLPAGDGLHQAGPYADQQFDRGDGAAKQHRSSDDGARRDLALHRQIGGETQRRRLHHQPQEFDGPGIVTARQLGVCLGGGGQLALFDLTRDRRLAHAEGADDLGLAGDAFLGGIGLVLGLDGLVQTRAGVAFVQPRQGEQDGPPHQGQNPDGRVKQEGAQQIDRGPRRIEQGQHALPTDGAAHIVELTQRLGVGRLGLQIDDPGQYLAGQQPVQPQSGPQHQPPAQPVEPRQGGQGEDGDRCDENECGQSTGRYDTVIDLHHVERGGQVKQVDQSREYEGPDEMGLARRQRLGEGLGARLAGKQVL